MEIHVLDPHTANLIAAGEVVERPASAIKEMLENAADAGATRVTVEIQNGGISYFRVTDNGAGMSKEDLPKAILRHATSKISSPSDLYAIGTYGFRGEALAAIAAVCDLRILTKRREDPCGSMLHAAGGKVLEEGDAGCPDGTTVAASEIFGNMPARRKFLKKDVSEANACYAVVEKFALSRPDIAVTFLSDGTAKLKSPGDGVLKNAVYACLGREFTEKLLPVGYEYEGITVSGYIGKPETARAGRSMQNFFVNNRFVRSGTICAALEEGFRAFCPAGRFPAAVLFCTLDCGRVDVNVHPAKTEVKFSEEKKVFEAVLFAVKTALNKGTLFAPDGSSEAPAAPLAFPASVPPASRGAAAEEAEVGRDEKPLGAKKLAEALGVHAPLPHASTETLRDADRAKSAEKSPAAPPAPDLRGLFAEDLDVSGFRTDGTFSVHAPSAEQQLRIVTPAEEQAHQNEQDADKADGQDRNGRQGVDDDLSETQTSFSLFSGLSAAPDMPKTPDEPKTSDVPHEKARFRLIGECFDAFILVEKDDALYLIDKHAAHERILYEEIKNVRDGASQLLLEPVRVSLSAEEYAAVTENADYFGKTGFSIEPFGANSVLLRSFPALLDARDLPEIFSSLAAKLAEGNGHAAGDLFDRALFTAACKAAVKAGQRGTLFQDAYLAEKIFSSEAVLYCPHGRPVLCSFSKEKLCRMFRRT